MRKPERYRLLVVAALLAAGPFAAAQPANGGGDSPSANAQRALAKHAIDRDDAAEAVACAARAAALAPGDADCQYVLGIAYGMAARQANVFRRLLFARKSAAAFRRAIALEPGNADFHQSLFEYYEQTPAVIGGGPERAAGEAAAVKRLDPARGALDYARLYAARKEYDLARAQLETILQTSPDDVTALYQTGRIAALSGQFLDRGLASLRLCLAHTPSPEEGAPTAAEVNLRIGNILEERGDKDGARVAYIKALAANPKFTPAYDALKKLNG
jgi:tetratricopeptide (TPR) repeat protein